MNRRIQIALVAFYLGVAITTFGHSWNRYTFADSRFGDEPRFYCAALSAGFWPLYWSVIIQSK